LPEYFATTAKLTREISNKKSRFKSAL